VPPALQPALHFRLQPAVRTFSSRFPVLSIWEYCQSPDPDGDMSMDLPGEHVLCVRSALDVYMRRLTAGEYAFLQHLSGAGAFEGACLAALEAEPGFDVERRFAGLVQEAVFTGFYH
jgi:hypothetical protein